MKFAAEKSAVATLIFFSVAALVLTILIRTSIYEPSELLLPLLAMIPVIFLLWVWFGTGYEISDAKLKYSSGPFKGSIEIASIREVKLSSAFTYAGKKASLSFSGLIICYNKFDELFIAPEDKRSLITELHRYNPDILINIPAKSESGAKNL